jgi:hypothetical protein
MRLLTAFLALALCAGCCVPSRLPSEPGRPVITVAIDHSQSASGLATGYDEFVRAAVEALDRGDREMSWRLVADPVGASVVVRHMPDNEDGECSTVGYYELGTNVVNIAPACAPGGLMFRTVVMHELMHWAGGRHICRTPGELPDPHHLWEDCSPVGAGRAVLNPYVYYSSDDPGCNPFEQACGGMVPTFELTNLDRAELHRARTNPTQRRVGRVR